MFARRLVRILLLLVSVISLLILSLSVPALYRNVWFSEDLPPPAASTIAAALAVIASVISGWMATRATELHEDALLPYPYPFFDARTRKGLLLVTVKNFGGSPAHDVHIVWERPLLDSNGKSIELGANGVIPVLLPGESVSRIVDGSIQYFQRNDRSDYSGAVLYADSSRRKRKVRFIASAEKFAGAPLYEDETMLTHEKLQALPEGLKEISGQINKIVDALTPQ